jgi:putative hemolysin
MGIGEFLLRQSGTLSGMLGLLVLSAFFSGSETALFSLSEGQLLGMSQSRRRLARLVPALMRRPDNVLTTALLGTNIVNILYYVLSGSLAIEARRQVTHGALWSAVLGTTAPLVMILLAEITPKTVAFLSAGRWAPPAAPVFGALGRVVGPLERVLTAGVIRPLTALLAPRQITPGPLSAEELSSLLTVSEKRGLIGADENALLREVIELSDLRAADIMVPRVDVLAYNADDPPEGLLERIRERRFTRVPVYEGDLDHVVGVVHAKRLLVERPPSLRDVMIPPVFIPESATLEKVLAQLRFSRRHLAVVVDEYGGTAGVLALEDVLEEIVGEIIEAGDADEGEALVRQVGPREWLVAGDLAIHEWEEFLPEDLQAGRFSTVGGLVISVLGRIPAMGESVRYSNIVFTVEGMRGRRVSLLRVRLEEQAT